MVVAGLGVWFGAHHSQGNPASDLAG